MNCFNIRDIVDMKICKEAVLHHVQNQTLDVTRGVQSVLVSLTSSVHSVRKSSQPTIVTRGYAEFKFPAEHIVFGVVFYFDNLQKRRDRIMVTYSRNCHIWEPIREKRGYGDPRVCHKLRFFGISLEIR